MAEPQYPLFDAIGRSESRTRSDSGMFLRLGAYLVQVAAIGTTLWLSSQPSWSAHRWLVLGACGLVAVGSGFVLIWPLARAVADALGTLLDRWRPPTLSLWVSPPPPARPPPVLVERVHPKAPHLRLVWDRSRQERSSG